MNISKQGILSLLIVIVLNCLSCSKEEESALNSDDSSTPTPTSSCGTINASASITHNGVNYQINSLSLSNSVVGIEIYTTNGPFTSSYTMNLLQVSLSPNCYESSSSTELAPGIGKFFEFQNIPSWAINTSTVSKIRITLDGSSYLIQDLNMDQ
jgi:hypothetical protein